MQQIYTWFVRGLTMQEITRRLNSDSDAPKPNRSVLGRWTQRIVRGVLADERYTGQWYYGKYETRWKSKADYARKVLRAQPLKVVQFDGLRIISDELWQRAQARLEQNISNGGRPPKDKDCCPRPRLLNGMFRCPTHNRPLYVGGAHGGQMICKDCWGLPAAERPLFGQLNRQLALELTCQKIAELIRCDEELLARVIAVCQEEAQKLQQPDPARLRQLRSQEDRLRRQIEFTLRPRDRRGQPLVCG